MSETQPETTGERRVTAEDVRALATVAELSLEPERAEDVAERLTVWFAAANELSEKMSAAEHLQCVPIANFTHPDSEVSE
jgi:hypothetical protein